MDAADFGSLIKSARFVKTEQFCGFCFCQNVRWKQLIFLILSIVQLAAVSSREA
jgi:hypothetical protein